MKNRLAVSALVLSLFYAPDVLAQSTEPPDSDDIISVSGRIVHPGLDEAVSIETLGASELERLAVVHPAEALNTVSGVNIHRGSGQEHLTAIRSPVLTGGAGAGSFLYLQNGVPLRAAGFANVNGLFESGLEFADDVEIFKGPGPAQYGSNAVHGLINVISRGRDNGNSLKLTGSEDGYGSAIATISTDHLSVSASLAHDDGFRADSGYDQQKIQMIYNNAWGDWSAEWLSAFQNLNQETAGFVQGDEAYKDPVLAVSNDFPEAFRDGKSYRTQLALQRDLDNETTLAITPYARRAELRFLRHFVPGQALEKNGHSSFGVMTALTGETFDVGFDVELTKGRLYEFQDNPDRFSFVQGLHFDYAVQSKTVAAYGQKIINLSEATKLDLGIRADYTHYRYRNNADTGASGRFIRVADRSDDFFVITPKLGLVHHLDNDLRLFARAARAARAPQVTDLYALQQNQTVGDTKTEILDSLEAGIKYETRELGFQLTAYRMWKDNFFFRNANGFNVTDGKTNHEGFELSSHIRPADWLKLSFNGSLARHRYDFTDSVSSPSSSITSGDRVDSAPDTLATGRVLFLPADGLETEFEWRHVGSYFTDPGNTQSYPGHDIFVFRSSYDVSDSIRIFSRVDNLFDRAYADRADFAFGNERYFPGRPRTLFLGLTSRF